MPVPQVTVPNRTHLAASPAEPSTAPLDAEAGSSIIYSTAENGHVFSQRDPHGARGGPGCGRGGRVLVDPLAGGPPNPASGSAGHADAPGAELGPHSRLLLLVAPERHGGPFLLSAPARAGTSLTSPSGSFQASDPPSCLAGGELLTLVEGPRPPGPSAHGVEAGGTLGCWAPGEGPGSELPRGHLKPWSRLYFF